MKAGINSIKSKRTGESRNFPVYRCTAWAPGHASIKKEILDNAVYVAVIDALWRKRDQPTNRTPGDDDRLVAIEIELQEVHAREVRLGEAISEGIVSRDAARSTAIKIAADRETLVKERDAITQSLVSDDAGEAWAAFWECLDLTGPGLVTTGPRTSTRRLTPQAELSSRRWCAAGWTRRRCERSWRSRSGLTGYPSNSNAP